MNPALDHTQLALMDALVCYWDKRTDATVVPLMESGAVQVLCDKALLERTNPLLSTMARARLDLTPYTWLPLRPRNYSLFLVHDEARRDRWAFHAGICRGLETCDHLLWSLVLLSPCRRAHISVERVFVQNQSEVTWLAAALPTLLSTAQELRAAAYTWADACRAEGVLMPVPDWQAIAREGLSSVRLDLSAETLHALTHKAT